VDEQFIQGMQARLDRLRAGDRAAAGELVALALSPLRGLVQQMLQVGFSRLGMREADSVINSAYPELIKELLKPNPPATPRAFLNLACCIIRHDLIDLARREGHPVRRAAPLDGTGSEDSRPLEPGADTLEPSRLAEWTEFHRLVGELPAHLREVFELHYYQGMTQAAIAGLLGLDAKTVSRMYLLAQKTVRERLEESGHFA
jgi:RNA polymerase sigma factor (sigma-70 family)